MAILYGIDPGRVERCLAAAALIFFAGLAPLRADEATDKVQAQKEAARANWKRLLDGQALVEQETPHLLLLATAGYTPKELRAVGEVLEKELSLARKALRLDAKTELWSGKLAVYLFEERGQFTSFMRMVAKKRPQPDDLGVWSLRGDQPFVAAGPPPEGNESSPEAQAGEQLADAVLSKKEGASDIPGWLALGFGKATVWRAQPAARTTRVQRALARKLVRKGRTAEEIWSGNLNADEMPVLQASLADFFAYGPGKSVFPGFVEGFKADERRTKKTTADALKSVQLNPERISRAYRIWVLRGY